MKKMNKLCLLLAASGSLVAFQCQALTVDVNVYRPNYSTSPGGEFTVTLDPSDAGDPMFAYIYHNYASVATLNGGFETFCVNESIPFNSPANATLTPGAITAGTAFLYYEFAKGNLVGYDYTTLGATGRGLSAWELQNAIWKLQGQTVYDQSAASVFLTSAQFTSVFATLADAKVLNNGALGVDQLDLGQVNGSRVYQPMLALVPDGGTTIMLMGIALGGFGLISRKLRRA